MLHTFILLLAIAAGMILLTHITLVIVDLVKEYKLKIRAYRADIIYEKTTDSTH